MKKIFCGLLVAFCFCCSLIAQEKAFSQVKLLQSNETYESNCPDVEALANYMQEIQQQLANYDSLGDGSVFIAIRPFNRSNVWFNLKDAAPDVLSKLKEEIVSIQPCDVQGGVVVFELTNRNPDEISQMPSEWLVEIEKMEVDSISVDDFLDVFWPAEVSAQDRQRLLKMIGEFKKSKDFSDKSLKKYSYITEYATKSDLISLTISQDYWPAEVSNTKYAAMFLLAYIAGNMEKQLLDENYEDSPQAGLEFEIYKYKQLKKVDKKLKIDFFEKKIK